jgi:hypothetical protein
MLVLMAPLLRFCGDLHGCFTHDKPWPRSSYMMSKLYRSRGVMLALNLIMARRGERESCGTVLCSSQLLSNFLYKPRYRPATASIP